MRREDFPARAFHLVSPALEGCFPAYCECCASAGLNLPLYLVLTVVPVCLFH